MKKQTTPLDFFRSNIKHILILTTLFFIFFTTLSFAQSTQWIIHPDSGDEYEHFGRCVDISGNYAIVGASGFMGSPSHPPDPAIYFFKREDNNWVEKQKIEGNMDTGFGWHVAISGSYAIVGYHSTKETYIYEREGEEWIEKAVLAKTYEEGGVDICGDYACVGKTDGVGQSNGEVYMYKRTAASWVLQSTITASDHYTGDGFGYSVSLKGDKLIVGVNRYLGPENRAVYIFKRDGEGWYQEAKLTPNGGPNQDLFGASVDMSDTLVIVGATDRNFNASDEQGYVYFFRKENGNWIEDGVFHASDGVAGNYFGYSVTLENGQAFVGAPEFTALRNGAVYHFSHGNSGWTELTKLVANGVYESWEYGYSVSSSYSGLIVGAPGDLGFAYIYQYTWDVPPHHFYFRESDYSQQIFACEEATFHFEARDENDQIEVNFSGVVGFAAVDGNNNTFITYPQIGFGNGVATETLSLMPSGEDVTIHLNYDNGAVTGISPYTFDVLPYWIIDFHDDTTLDYNVEEPITVDIFECGDSLSFPVEGDYTYIEFTAKIPGTDQEIGTFSPLSGNEPITNGKATILYTSPSAEVMGNNKDILFTATYTGPNRVWVEERVFQISGGGGEGGGFTNAQAFGGANNDVAVATSSNPNKSGGFYSVGTFVGSAQFGDYALIENGTFESGDIFITKTDSENNVIWAMSAGGTAQEVAVGIGVDTESNCYLAGRITNTAVFGSIELDNDFGYRVFAAKYNSSGEVQWVRASNDDEYGTDEAYGCSFDNNGNTYITGSFSKDITFTGNNETNSWSGYSDVGSDLFVIKYKPDGDLDWVYSASGDYEVIGSQLDVDAAGNVYVTGYHAETVTFGSTTLSGTGSFLIKLNSTGNLIWAKEVAGFSLAMAFKAMAVDNDGNTYISDTYIGGPKSDPSNPAIVKYNSSGDLAWLKLATTDPFNYGSGVSHAIAIDNNNNIYITGTFTGGELSFDDITLNRTGDVWNTMVFVFAFDQNGNALWVAKAGDDDEYIPPDSDTGKGITIDSNGDIILIGDFDGSAEFGDETLTSAGGKDIFLSKVSGAVTSIDNETDNTFIPKKLELSQNYPNPFNPTTIIKYSLPRNTDNFSVLQTKLIVYDILGREVAVLVNKQQMTGNYTVEFDASGLSTGIYIYQLTTGNLRATKKMLILK